MPFIFFMFYCVYNIQYTLKRYMIFFVKCIDNIRNTRYNKT